MDITKFEFKGQRVRVINDAKGHNWWVAKDVCVVLQLTNPTEAIRSLDEDERNTLRISEGIQRGNPNINVINEPGLYTLIIRSNKPEAKKFKRWITHEVLPSIRKTGEYAHSGAVPAIPRSFNHAGLRPNQRIRLLELAGRIAQMDEAGRNALFETYGRLCETAGGELVTAEDEGLSEFLETQCQFGPGNRTSKDDLYNAYAAFITEAGTTPLHRSAFFREIYKRQGLQPARPLIGGRRYWYVNGIALVH